MKRWFVLLICTGLLSALSASSWCGWLAGEPTIIGEFLYIRPHACDLDYVIIDSRPANIQNFFNLFDLPSGEQQTACMEYRPGFRAGGNWRFGKSCIDVQVTYMRLTAVKSQLATIPQGPPGTSSGGLWPTYGEPRYLTSRLDNASVIGAPPPNAIDALAKQRTRVLYQVVDGEIGRRKGSACGLWARSFGSLRYCDISLLRDVYYQGTSVRQTSAPFPALERHTIHSRSKTWGVGPRIGLELKLPVLCGFGIGARVGGSLLVGESQYKLAQRDLVFDLLSTVPFFVDEPSFVIRQTQTHFFPEVDARLGVNYCYAPRWWCFSLLIELGWEFESNIDAISDLRFNDLAGTSSDVCSSFCVDGLYLLFDLRF